jgi:hypothetical protein
MRTNLSPGPGYKLRERNSMMHDVDIKNQLSDSDISGKVVMIRKDLKS